MHSLLGLSAELNFMSQKLMLDWAKKNYSEEKYKKILKSYNNNLKYTTLFVVLVCIPIIILFTSMAFNSPFSSREELKNTPTEATGYVLARVDYDGNFFWTHDSQKYEYALIDYDISPEGYEFNDKIKVYVDDNQNIIKVMPIPEGPSIREIEVIVGSLGGIIVPVLLIIFVWIPISKRTFGKAWYEFGLEYNKRSSTDAGKARDSR